MMQRRQVTFFATNCVRAGTTTRHYGSKAFFAPTSLMRCSFATPSSLEEEGEHSSPAPSTDKQKLRVGNILTVTALDASVDVTQKTDDTGRRQSVETVLREEEKPGRQHPGNVSAATTAVDPIIRDRVLTKIHYRAAMTCPKKLWWSLSELSGDGVRTGLGSDGAQMVNSAEHLLSNPHLLVEALFPSSYSGGPSSEKSEKEEEKVNPLGHDIAELLLEPDVSLSDGAMLTMWPDLLKRLPNSIPAELKVRWGDAAAFGGIAREFERRQLTKMGGVRFITGSFERAVEQTDQCIQRHFGNKSPEQIAALPPFALQSAAFEATISVPIPSKTEGEGEGQTVSVKVRARPGLLRWTPGKKDLLMAVPGKVSSDQSSPKTLAEELKDPATRQVYQENPLALASRLGHWQVIEHRAALNLTTASAAAAEHDFTWTAFVLKRAKCIDVNSCGFVKLNRAHVRSAYNIVKPQVIPHFQLRSICAFHTISFSAKALQHVSGRVEYMCALLAAGVTPGKQFKPDFDPTTNGESVGSPDIGAIVPSTWSAAHFVHLSAAHKKRNEEAALTSSTLNIQQDADYMSLKSACEAQPSFFGSHCSATNCPYAKRCIPPADIYPNSVFSVARLKANTKRMLWNRGLKGSASRDLIDMVKLSAPQQRYIDLVAKQSEQQQRKTNADEDTADADEKRMVEKSDDDKSIKIKTLIEGEDYEISDHASIHAFYKSLTYPIICLDFETSQWAVPAFSKAAAYDQIPFQYSMHVWYRDFHGGTEEPEHFEFVHLGGGYDPTCDPRPAFIRHIVRDLAQIEKNFRRHRPEEAQLREAGDDATEVCEDGDVDVAVAVGQKKKKGPPKKKKKTFSHSPLLGTLLCHNATFEKGVIHKMKLYIDATNAEHLKHADKPFFRRDNNNTPRIAGDDYDHSTNNHHNVDTYTSSATNAAQFQREVINKLIPMRYFDVENLKLMDTMDLAKYVTLRAAEGSASIKSLMPVLTDKPWLRSAYKEGSIGDGLAANSHYRLLASRWAFSPPDSTQSSSNKVKKDTADLETLLARSLLLAHSTSDSVAAHQQNNNAVGSPNSNSVQSDMETLRQEMLRYCGIDTLAVREVACGIFRLVNADPAEIACFTTLEKNIRNPQLPNSTTTTNSDSLSSTATPKAKPKRGKTKKETTTGHDDDDTIKKKSTGTSVEKPKRKKKEKKDRRKDPSASEVRVESNPTGSDVEVGRGRGRGHGRGRGRGRARGRSSS